MYEQKKYYNIKARTNYKELDPPKSLLENYHTHKLEFISDKPVIKYSKNDKKWIDTVKFPKVQQPAYYF